MVAGVFLLVFAGVVGGSFAVPMRYMPKWAWENYWTIWSCVALVILPWSLAALTAPSLASVYSASGPRAVLSTASLGFLWGIAGFLFGLSVEMLGMSLTFAIVNGLGTAVGTWIPLVALHSEDLFTPGGIIISGGVCTVIVGVAICSWAGKLRSREAQAVRHGVHSAPATETFGTGLAIAVVSGVLGPCLNLGIAFGGRIPSSVVIIETTKRRLFLRAL
jgi:L-rhamnose-H+ transport protein